MDLDIGFTTENAVKAVRKNVSDKQHLDFRLSCKNFLKAVVAKLLNKTTFQYPLANNLAFLDPRLFRLDALALSVIATATWLAGWLGGCHTRVLYQNG